MVTYTELEITEKDILVDLYPKKFLNHFTKIDLKDSKSRLFTTKSSVCGKNYTLYLVSSIDDKNQNQHLYSHSELDTPYQIILNIGKFNPVSLFGGFIECAAIDSEGRIILIDDNFYKTPTKNLSPLSLPNKEKDVNIVLCRDVDSVLSSTGCDYEIKLKSNQPFSEIRYLKDIIITCISGVFNSFFFAVSDEGLVFVKGIIWDSLG